MKLVIYMPAFNEAESIQQVIGALPRQLPGIDAVEILVVDDGSSDATGPLALASGARVVTHGHNRGVGAAFQSAIQFALQSSADLLVGIDADGQFDPCDIPLLLEPILDGDADAVIGNRFSAGRPEYMQKARYWGNLVVAKLINYVSNEKFQDVSCGFRAHGREALLRLNTFAEYTYTHESILSLVLQGLRVQQRPVTIRYFPGRKSRVAASLFRYAVRTAAIILRVLLDYRPLRVFGSIVAVFMAMGIALEIFLFAHFVRTGAFTPYKNTGFVGLGFIVFSMLVLVIALIADMLNRVRQNQDRLLYELRRMRFG